MSEATTQHLTIKQAAARLGVHERTVRNWIKAGRIPALKIGRTVRIDPADLTARDSHVQPPVPVPVRGSRPEGE